MRMWLLHRWPPIVARTCRAGFLRRELEKQPAAPLLTDENTPHRPLIRLPKMGNDEGGAIQPDESAATGIVRQAKSMFIH